MVLTAAINSSSHGKQIAAGTTWPISNPGGLTIMGFLAITAKATTDVRVGLHAMSVVGASWTSPPCNASLS
jgi:hypothetical protein